MFESHDLKQLQKELDAIRHEFLSNIAQVKSQVYNKTAQSIDDFVLWDIQQQKLPFKKEMVLEYKAKCRKLWSLIDADLKLKTSATSEVELQEKRQNWRQHFQDKNSSLRSNIESLRRQNKVSELTVKKAEELLAFREQDQDIIVSGKMPRKEFKKRQNELERLQNELVSLIDKDMKNHIPWGARLLYRFQKWLLNLYLNLHASRPRTK